MTLKEFAAEQGVSYETVRTWQKRGRLLRDGEGFKFAQVGAVEPSLKRRAKKKIRAVGGGSKKGSSGGSKSEPVQVEPSALTRRLESLEERVARLEAGLDVPTAEGRTRSAGEWAGREGRPKQGRVQYDAETLRHLEEWEPI
jgi:hypothetical protein